MNKIPDSIKENETLQAAFLADKNGVLLDQFETKDGVQLAAISAYIAHCLRTVEGEFGMFNLTKIKIDGAHKSLVMSYKDTNILGVVGAKDLKLLD